MKPSDFDTDVVEPEPELVLFDIPAPEPADTVSDDCGTIDMNELLEE